MVIETRIESVEKIEVYAANRWKLPVQLPKVCLQACKVILWGAVCVKIEYDFIYHKNMHNTRDLVNGTLQFSKWDAAI